jgi:hypothetical protein
MKIVGLTLLAIAVYALHQDFWNWNKYEPLLFGFLPVGLWYHACYACLCSLWMWLLGRTVWPHHLDAVEAQVSREPHYGEGH